MAALVRLVRQGLRLWHVNLRAIGCPATSRAPRSLTAASFRAALPADVPCLGLAEEWRHL